MRHYPKIRFSNKVRLKMMKDNLDFDNGVRISQLKTENNLLRAYLKCLTHHGGVLGAKKEVEQTHI